DEAPLPGATRLPPGRRPSPDTTHLLRPADGALRAGFTPPLHALVSCPHGAAQAQAPKAAAATPTALATTRPGPLASARRPPVKPRSLRLLVRLLRLVAQIRLNELVDLAVEDVTDLRRRHLRAHVLGERVRLQHIVANLVAPGHLALLVVLLLDLGQTLLLLD